MQECRKKLKNCLKQRREFPDTQLTCRQCVKEDLCVNTLTKECEKYTKCWTPFLGFINANAGANYAEVWHTLKSNNINSKDQLVAAEKPMKFWPYFVGKEGSSKYNDIQNTIANLKDLAKQGK